MTYIGMGSEASGPSYWNAVNGVCKPGDAMTLDRFKTMQTQMNRVASAVGLTKIGVDGDIGPKTMTLLSKISAKMNYDKPTELALANTASSDCNAVARDSGTITSLAKAVADARGVGAVATPSGGGRVTTPAGPITIPPAAPISASVLDRFNAMPLTQKAALGVGFVAVAVATGVIKLGKKFGKRRRRSS